MKFTILNEKKLKFNIKKYILESLKDEQNNDLEDENILKSQEVIDELLDSEELDFDNYKIEISSGGIAGYAAPIGKSNK
jgi:ribosome maturation factor RimP